VLAVVSHTVWAVAMQSWQARVAPGSRSAAGWWLGLPCGARKKMRSSSDQTESPATSRPREFR
jgi:hypothetical protein